MPADPRDIGPACVAGPEGCDPRGAEMVRCEVCGELVCDFHGDYPSDGAFAEGDWRCPSHVQGPEPL